MSPARRTPLAPLAVAVVLLLLATISRPARALNEGDVAFTVTQSPAAPATVQVGATVTFTVTATVTTSIGAAPLLFDFDYPAELSYVGFSGGAGVVTCANDTPSPGTVRCNYGPVAPGALEAVTLTFVTTADATTSPGQAVMRAGASAPDSAATGDDAFIGAGTLEVFELADFALAGAPAPAETFERALVTYTATLGNESGTPTGAFDVSVQFPGAILANVTCSSGTGSPSGSAAQCVGASLAPGEQLSIAVQLRPDDTPGGTDVGPVLQAPALGIASFDLPAVTVHELGLQRTSAAPAVGAPITVCTANVASDVTDLAAAGRAQPFDPAQLVGTVSAQATLQLADFEVAGPAPGSPAPATGCGTNQSGVTFTPTSPGVYTIRARYNLNGTNTLTVTVPGASNPVPVLSSVSPTGATAGSASVTLALYGSGFVPGSAVHWNGSPLASVTYVSDTSLTALVPSSLLASPGTAAVTVVNPTPGGGTSAARTFTIAGPAVKLAFITQPGNGIAGQPITVQPVVAVQDSAGNTVASDNATIVTLAISGGATLTCTGGLSKMVVSGIASFAGCSVNPAGTNYTLTASASPTLTPATSTPFTVNAAVPTATSQLAFPAPSGPVPRSRLTFTVQSGTLSPAEVRLVIRRNADGKYWSGQSASWEDEPHQNVMTSAGSGQWQLPLIGSARRSFVGTSVTLEAFATASGNEYRSAATVTFTVR